MWRTVLKSNTAILSSAAVERLLSIGRDILRANRLGEPSCQRRLLEADVHEGNHHHVDVNENYRFRRRRRKKHWYLVCN